jgi:hypothetical protein
VAEAAEIRRTTLSPARRWLRRAAAAVLCAPLLAALPAVPSTASSAHAAPSVSGSRTAEVSLGSLSPAAPGKGDTLNITGTVVNRGKQTITEAELELRVGPRLTGRTSIDRAARRTGYSPGNEGLGIDDKYTVKLPRLVAGIGQDFSLSVPVNDLDLGEPGVYQIGVALSGKTTAEPVGQVLGIKRTFLPWQPEALDRKIGFTYLWPLVSSTHLTSETRSDAQQTPVFEDESLADELAPGGRLGQLVSLGRNLPVTWVIDPDLLASVDAMTGEYEVEDGERTVPGRNQDVAKQWLASLESAVKGRKVVALPFADPDLASLAHRGKSVSGSLSHLQQATEVAASTVETIIHQKPSVDFAWPVEGAVDPSIVAVATSAGAHHVIARGDSIRDDLPYTPSAARPIGGGTTAVVTDYRLSKAFEGDMLNSGGSTLAVQQFLAQTLAVALQETEGKRSIVVAPQRRPTVSQAQSMSQALETLGSQRWTQWTDLVAAADTEPDPSASGRVPPSSRYPSRLRKQELPVTAFQDIRTTQNTLDNFKVILTDMDRVETPFSRAIDREMSTSWRGQPTEAQQYRTAVQQNLQGLVGEVRLIEKSQITLSGRSATIPVTVQNRLLQGVDNLVLRLTSENSARLGLDGEKGVAQRPIAIKGGHSQSVRFDAMANANGQVQLTAQLYTEDGKPYGEKMQFTVKVSEFTPTLMLVIAGGVLLLVLAGVRMYTQRKRAAGLGGPESGGTPATGDGTGDDTGPAAGEPGPSGEPDPPQQESTPVLPPGREDEHPDPGQPSDPGPDTGPESGKLSGAGEKVDR